MSALVILGWTRDPVPSCARPGASVGTSKLLIELDLAKSYGANLTLDNYGSRYTGAYRLGCAFKLASPLRPKPNRLLRLASFPDS